MKSIDEQMDEMIKRNGNNRFWIEVKCPDQIPDGQWLAILLILERVIQRNVSGTFENVHAVLCEKETP